MKKFLLSIFAVMLAVFSVQAQSDLIYTLTPASGSNNSYAGNCDITIDGIKWNLTGNAQMLPWRMGGKSISETDRALYSKTPMNGAVDKVVLTIGTMTSITVNSAKLLVADNVDFKGATEVAFTAKANSSIDIPVSAASGSYFKFLFNVTVSDTKSNRYIQISKAEFYGTTGTPGVETVATPIITPETTTFNEGESVFVSIATETQDAEIYYTLDGTDPSTENGELYEGEIEITETTTVKAIAVKDGWNNSEVAEAKYTKNVVVEGGVVDVLNLALTGAEGTTYSSWSGKTSKSSAVYAGQSAGGNNSIQLRSSNSNSGIVTTQSGGKVKKISIDWNSNTAATRELWVYGSNTAYTNPTELYNASTDGDKLAEIACGTTEFVIEGDYEYIGLRSGSGAMYLNSIEITWVEEEEPVAETWSSFYAAFPVAIPEGIEAYIVTAANAGYVTLTQIYNAVPASTGVILKGGSIEATNDNYYSGEVTEVTGNLLKGTMANTHISEEAYVLGKVDGVIGLYKALMTDGKWLNNANKAYLPMSAVANKSAQFFGFDWEGTTGVDEMKEQRAESKEIYDLTGRKVETITERGIYIVGGKKVLVK